MELTRHKYHNAALLSDYFNLQKELSSRTFGEQTQDKRIWDVYNHLANINKEKRGVATAQLETFEKDCSFVFNTISATLSGCRGEKAAFKSLDTIKEKHIVLKNVELAFDGHRTEIDAVVLTKKGAIIVEVKNTARNVTITQSGNLKRLNRGGQYVTDCALGLKMNDKEFVLRKALEKSDYKRVPIKSVVVFTNSEIVVDNQNKFIQTCSLSELPHVIEMMANTGSGNYWISEMKNMAEAINKSRTSFVYSGEEEIEKIKAHYEELMFALSQDLEKKSVFEKLKKLFAFKRESIAAAS